ncbi:unnamed protein product [Cochlearia groenlandica]
MVRCFVLDDIQSQPQYWANQRKNRLNNAHEIYEEGNDDSDTDSDDMQQEEEEEEEEEEELYRVNVDDDTHPSHEFINEPVQIPSRRGQPEERINTQSNVRRGHSSQRSGGTGSRGSRRKKSFEATIQDIITSYREFKQKKFSTTSTRFYWACINSLEELVFWRKYFIDIARSTDEDKSQLLEAMTGVSRNNEDVPRQLGSTQSSGSPNSGGSQWDTPPAASHQWSTPPVTQQWGTPSPTQQWATPPTQQWGTLPAQQWAPTQQWNIPPSAQQ